MNTEDKQPDTVMEEDEEDEEEDYAITEAEDKLYKTGEYVYYVILLNHIVHNSVVTEARDELVQYASLSEKRARKYFKNWDPITDYPCKDRTGLCSLVLVRSPLEDWIDACGLSCEPLVDQKIYCTYHTYCTKRKIGE